MLKCAGVYPTDAGTLFVPSDGMRFVHEASTPTAIFRRAGYSSTLWGRWQLQFQGRWPEVIDLLYSDINLRGPGLEWLQPTEAMLAFHREASERNIFAAARALALQQTDAPANQARRLGISAKAARWHDKKNKQFRWFWPWRRQGASLPPNVKTATKTLVRACGKAWHYGNICGRAGVHYKTYIRWVVKGEVPDKLRPWLFGDRAPHDCFVIGEDLYRLHMEMSLQSIAENARLSYATVFGLEDNPETSELLAWATAWADKTGARNGEIPPWPERFRRRSAKLLRSVLQYARAAKTVCCCERASLSRATYCERLEDAERLGVRELVESFLRHRPPFSGRKRQQQGLIQGKLFIPSQAMLRFRAAAQEEASECALAKAMANAKDLPGILNWFLDWTDPRKASANRASTKLGTMGPASEKTPA
jgi:hypothetical protein